MSSITEDRTRLLEILKKDAFFTGDFTLSSGKKSSYYLDARLVTLSPEGAYLCGKIILDMVKDDNLDAIGGPTLGADPMIGAVGSLSFQQGNPYNTFIIRKESKGHGKGNMIEGPALKDAARLAVIDDVATTGKAFIHSIDALAPLDIIPVKCICIVDRNDGAKEAVAARGSKLESIFNIEEFLD